MNPKEKATLIIGGIVVLIAVFFCNISEYFGLKYCPDVTHTISYGDETLPE